MDKYSNARINRLAGLNGLSDVSKESVPQPKMDVYASLINQGASEYFTDIVKMIDSTTLVVYTQGERHKYSNIISDAMGYIMTDPENYDNFNRLSGSDIETTFSEKQLEHDLYGVFLQGVQFNEEADVNAVREHKAKLHEDLEPVTIKYISDERLPFALETMAAISQISFVTHILGDLNGLCYMSDEFHETLGVWMKANCKDLFGESAEDRVAAVQKLGKNLQFKLKAETKHGNRLVKQAGRKIKELAGAERSFLLELARIWELERPGEEIDYDFMRTIGEMHKVEFENIGEVTGGAPQEAVETKVEVPESEDKDVDVHRFNSLFDVSNRKLKNSGLSKVVGEEMWETYGHQELSADSKKELVKLLYVLANITPEELGEVAVEYVDLWKRPGAQERLYRLDKWMPYVRNAWDMLAKHVEKHAGEDMLERIEYAFWDKKPNKFKNMSVEKQLEMLERETLEEVGVGYEPGELDIAEVDAGDLNDLKEYLVSSGESKEAAELSEKRIGFLFNMRDIYGEKGKNGKNAQFISITPKGSKKYYAVEFRANDDIVVVAECPYDGHATYILRDSELYGGLSWETVFKHKRTDAQKLGAHQIIHAKNSTEDQQCDNIMQALDEMGINYIDDSH